MSPRRGVLVVAGAIAALTLAACGDRKDVVIYKQGQYQGKPDTPPWDNAAPQNNPQVVGWQQGSQSSWEQSIKARNQAQNEYVRLKDK
jgi:hypothetical protein